MGLFTVKDRSPIMGQQTTGQDARTGQAQVPYEAPPEKKIEVYDHIALRDELLEIKNILNGYEERFKRMDILLDAISIDSVV